jgi:brefeldin A-resistance guanine nucleotide exchange factor 1
MRIDEALRLFLEAFRLPGESPLISNVLEHFAKHYRLANASISEIYNCFFNDDAVFTLSYAIIMLNVDQHNHNAKKQSNPMLVEEFKKNLTKTNGTGNFDDKLLEEIYQVSKQFTKIKIKND